MKKHKLRLAVSTIQVLQQKLDGVRGGMVADSEGCGSLCVTWCRPDCKPSPYSRAGDWCV